MHIAIILLKICHNYYFRKYLYITGGSTTTTYMADGGYVSIAITYASSTDLITYTVTYATTTLATTGGTTTNITVSQASATTS